LRLDLDIAGDPFAQQVPELQAVPLRGVPFLDETVLYHRPTQTLIGADIVLCGGAEDHWTWRCAARLTGCYGRVRVPPDVRKTIPDKSVVARSLQGMLELPSQRLIVAHADVIGADCRERLAQAWRLEGVEV
jgi:hypothetical protein